MAQKKYAVSWGNPFNDSHKTETFDTREEAESFVKDFNDDGDVEITEYVKTDNGWEIATSGKFRSLFGNPGEVKLHEALASIEDWLDYEASVVEEAADEISDPEISEAAEEQAEAMEEAADAVGEAAEAARDTAAEVFNETGVATSENVGDGTPEGDAIGGNPEGVAFMVTNNSRYPLDQDELDRFHKAFKDKAEGTAYTSPGAEVLPEGWKIVDSGGAVIYGNPDVPDLPGGGIPETDPVSTTPRQPVTSVPDAKPESPSRYFRPVKIGNKTIGGW